MICDENGINYTSAMVTNGYDLTEKNYDILKKCKINSIQITVDGDAETHDKRRFLRGGYPTFDNIISNICSLKDETILITLRINIDRSNFKKAENVLEVLKEKKLINRVFPYIAKVENFDNCYDDESCLSGLEFCYYQTIFNDLMIEYGYKKEDMFKLPKRINGVCGCDRDEAYVIDADGGMYKCWNDIGKKEISVGNIKDSNIILNKEYLDYIMFDPTLDFQCSRCKYLPICMGGCAKLRINKEKNICDGKKYNFNLKLKDLVSYMKKMKMTSQAN